MTKRTTTPKPADEQLLVTTLTKPQRDAVLDVEIDSLPDSAEISGLKITMPLSSVSDWTAAVNSWITESDVDQRVRRLVEAAKERVHSNAQQLLTKLDAAKPVEPTPAEPEQTQLDPHDWLVAKITELDVKSLGSYTRISHAVEEAAVMYAPSSLLALAADEYVERLSGATAEWKQLKAWADRLLSGDAKLDDVPMIANLVVMKAKGQRSDYVQTAKRTSSSKSTTPKRSAATDDELRAYCSDFLDELPTKGWTFALRTLRALGQSANHKQFVPIFDDVKSTKPQPEPKPPKSTSSKSTKPPAKPAAKRTTKAAAKQQTAAKQAASRQRADAGSAKATGVKHEAAKRAEQRRAAKPKGAAA